MQLIQLETYIAAPPDRCFLLSLNLDLHMASTAPTRERAIAGVTHGLIGPGETVTWRGRHFGFLLTHRSLISQYERPRHFQDVMLRGMFKSFRHDHSFGEPSDGTTLMRDELRFAAPSAHSVGWRKLSFCAATSPGSCVSATHSSRVSLSPRRRYGSPISLARKLTVCDHGHILWS